MNLKYYAHPSSIIDEHCEIGEGTKIWHFSHIMSNCNLSKCDFRKKREGSK